MTSQEKAIIPDRNSIRQNHSGLLIIIGFIGVNALWFGLGLWHVAWWAGIFLNFVLIVVLADYVGQRVPLGAPEFPADVGVNVIGLEADLVEDTDGGGQDDLADAVAGHGDDGSLGQRDSSRWK